MASDLVDDWASYIQSPEYQAFLEDLAADCHCCPCCQDIPCAGLLAGGLCDYLHCIADEEDLVEEDLTF